MKRALKISGIVVALFIVALLVAFLFIDGIAKTGIERGSTFALGTRTAVDAVDLSVTGGSLEIKGMNVDNPAGYEPGQVLAVGRTYVSLDVSSLLSDVVDVREVVVEAPVLSVRGKGLETNLGVILANLEKAAPSGGGEPEARAEPAEAVKMRVGLVRVEGAVLQYDLPGIAAGSVKLPDIRLEKISTEKGATVTMAEVIKQVLAQMAMSAAEQSGIPATLETSLGAVARELPEAIRKGDIEGISSAVEGISGLIDGGRDTKR